MRISDWSSDVCSSDLVELLDPALHLGGMRGARLEALDELDLLGQHRLLALELRLAMLLVQRALLVVEIVIPRIGGERAAIDLDDLADDAVHELAVMRGHQQRAVIALQESFEQIGRASCRERVCQYV